MHSRSSGAADLARDHPEPEIAGLSPLVRDRQRIVQCSAFRRLQQKAQVFVALDNPNFRTRMSHTLEVAHLARRLAVGLELNEALAEVLALAHDLGHPPFGHAGERALHECMRAHGGFEHNRQTLRVVEYLEHPYTAFRGLNLTRVVRESLAKHRTPYDEPQERGRDDGRPPPAEELAVALADRISYTLHDLKDGLHAGLVPVETLAEVELWQIASQGGSGETRQHVLRVLQARIDSIREMLVTDARSASEGPHVALSSAMLSKLETLGHAISISLYKHPLMAQNDAAAEHVVRSLFSRLVEQPDLMGTRYFELYQSGDGPRAVADYIAGMTDRFCQTEQRRLERG